jgi:putative transcriptional regulator
MDFRGAEKAEAAEVLMKAGFAVSETCYSRPSCFDFAAGKDETLVFLKVQADVGTLSSRDAQELERISNSLSATVLLISERGRDKPLEDDTVYSRHSIPAITQKTLENFVFRNTSPLMQANPGGCYVEIDGDAIKRRRQELGLSIGKLAQIVGVSYRTLYGYERGMAKASVQTAYNLIWALGTPVAKPVNMFEKPESRSKCQLLAKAKRIIGRNRLFYRMFKRFSNCNVTTVNRAPFDFVLNIPDEEKRIIGGFAANSERDLDRRIREILSISEIVHARPILLTQGQEPANRTISCLQCDEIAKSSSPEDLISSVV